MSFSIIKSDFMTPKDVALLMQDLKFALHEMHWVEGQPFVIVLKHKIPITDSASMEMFASNVNLATKLTNIHPFDKIPGKNLVSCYISAKISAPDQDADKASEDETSTEEKVIPIPLKSNVKKPKAAAPKKVVKKAVKKTAKKARKKTTRRKRK